jgi:hypothetical protein
MVPSLANTLIKGKKATDILEHKWIDTFFHPKVGKVNRKKNNFGDFLKNSL